MGLFNFNFGSGKGIGIDLGTANTLVYSCLLYTSDAADD